MNSLHHNESADEYAAIIIQINSGTRVIRCRHDLHWIMQKRSSPDLNKGYWIGLSNHHTTWDSLLAYYTDLALPAVTIFSRTTHSQLAMDDQVDG
jgi:hypothetical protein